MGTGDRACAAIAEKQFGLISRDQAIRTGMSERAIGRRLGAGRWRQVLPGVYRLAGPTPGKRAGARRVEGAESNQLSARPQSGFVHRYASGSAEIRSH